MSRFAIAIATMAALLAFAAPARAETIDGVAVSTEEAAGAADSAAEIPTSAEPPEPAPASVPEPSVSEPVQAPEVADAGEAVGGSPAPSSPAPVPSSAPAPPAAAPISAISEAVPVAPVEAEPPLRLETEPDASVATPVHRVSKLARGVVDDSVEDFPGTAASAVEDALKPVASAIERTASSVRTQGPLSIVAEAVRQPAPVQQLFEVAVTAGEVADHLVIPAMVEGGLLPEVDQVPPLFGGAPVGPALGAPHSTPSFSGSLSIGAMLEGWAGGPGGLQARYLAGFGGPKSSGLGAAERLGAAKGTLGTLSFGGPSGAVQRSNGPTPLDDPGPLPGSPGAAASGSGASIFVPIAALLALLALVAPATLRRLREAPDFPVPTPFVCALERPG